MGDTLRHHYHVRTQSYRSKGENMAEEEEGVPAEEEEVSVLSACRWDSDGYACCVETDMYYSVAQVLVYINYLLNRKLPICVWFL